jgi:archaellum component FlaC
VLPGRSVDKRLAALEFEIEQINDRLTEIDEHIDELRVDLENNADDVCDKIREDLNGISEEVRNLKRRFDSSE